ncbi:TetR family transcriptional regulator [Microlunatus sp. GCM10028923]|uniref:TetR/AcrR family transcriptional regulator n=1 Tax=Microlunatus sp. GCM10028923 TaxID=3273400 RepID=UPI0036185916
MTTSPRTGRRPGRPTTRAEIVTAATALFAERGYQGTSLRRVAAEAGVDPALVRRFYGSKEELFGVVMRSVLRPEDVVPVALNGPRRTVGRRLATTMLQLFGASGQPTPALGVIRSAIESDQAATFVRTFVAEEMLGRLTRELGVDQPELRAALATSQLVGLAIGRYAIRAPGLVTADTEQLVAWIGPVLQRYLTGPAPAA